MENILKIIDIKKKFSEQMILNGISFEVNAGETIGIIGESGGGKSTFLRILAGLETADEGIIKFEGENLYNNNKKLDIQKIKTLRKKIGMIFQSFNLFDHMTALENVTSGLLIRGINKKEAKTIAEKQIEKVGLINKINNLPSQLSGGEKQRIAIARALAIDPDLILFDEPTSALDPKLKIEVLSVIEKLKQEKRTMIIVSHEMNFINDISDKIIAFENGKIKTEK